MMEVLQAPQTHLALKSMIEEVDEDGDGRLSFREFLLVYRKAQAGELAADSGLAQLAKLTEVDVDKVGVNGAKEFFEAKVGTRTKNSRSHLNRPLVICCRLRSCRRRANSRTKYARSRRRRNEWRRRRPRGGNSSCKGWRFLNNF